jgi:hypothetical protein
MRTVDAVLNRHIACDPKFVASRLGGPPDHARVGIAKSSDRAWLVHFILEGDGITRCGLDAQDMCVQPNGAPRLLLVRACRFCASRLTTRGVRELSGRRSLRQGRVASNLASHLGDALR